MNKFISETLETRAQILVDSGEKKSMDGKTLNQLGTLKDSTIASTIIHLRYSSAMKTGEKVEFFYEPAKFRQPCKLVAIIRETIKIPIKTVY